MRNLKFAVIGAGAGGTLMAVQLKSKGFKVALMDKNKEIVDKMNEIGYLKATGKTEAQVSVDLITTNIKDCRCRHYNGLYNNRCTWRNCFSGFTIFKR